MGAALWGAWAVGRHPRACFCLLPRLAVHSGIDPVFPFSPQLTPSSFLRIGQLSNVDLNEDVRELVSGTERGPPLPRPLAFFH